MAAAYVNPAFPSTDIHRSSDSAHLIHEADFCSNPMVVLAADSTPAGLARLVQARLDDIGTVAMSVTESIDSQLDGAGDLAEFLASLITEVQKIHNAMADVLAVDLAHDEALREDADRTLMKGS